MPAAGLGAGAGAGVGAASCAGSIGRGSSVAATASLRSAGALFEHEISASASSQASFMTS
jgi:hypothetical protein